MTTSSTYFHTSAEIMVVEDNPLDIQFLSQILTRAGHLVRPASDGELAMRSVLAKLPDLMLLDVNLPDMDGVELCRRLKADPGTKDMPIIFISALGRTDLKVKALQEGGVDYVTKPFEPEEVLARIDTHLKVHRLQQKLEAQSEQLMAEIEVRKQTETELQLHRDHLEALVEERTAALGEREERYESLFQSSFDGIAESTLNGRLIFCNPAYADMTGQSAEELKKHRYQDITPPKWADLDAKQVQQCLEQGYSDIYEKELIGKDGAIVPISTRTWLRKNASGNPVSLWSIVQDITERKQAEEALKQSDRRNRDAQKLLQLVLDTIPVRLFWKDLNLVYLGCNQLFAQDAGCHGPEELIGADDYSIGWKEQAEKYRQDDLEVMSSGKPRWNFEEIQTTPEGKQITLSTSKVPLRDADNTIIGVLGAYEDITQRKWAEEELLRAQKLESLGRLAGGIAHDFNNILMGILGNISFAKMQLSPQKTAYERLVNAEAACLRAKELTHQFLTFSTGGAPVRMAISAGQVVTTYGQLALSGAKSTCTYSIPDDLWKINADEGQIGQVVTNILINADQAMEHGGLIEVHCENVAVDETHGVPLNKGRYVRVSVKDHGVGIPVEDLGIIFDPYFTTKKTGRGLGLASAYSIMKKHEGHLAVESTPGAGTTIRFYIPASDSPATSPEAVDPTIFSGSGTILVVDDDVLVLQAVEAMLENLGYEVELAADGEEAVAKYIKARQSGRPFDLVIMDLIIQDGMGGEEATGKLLEVDPQARVIVSSGYSNDPILSDYRRYGFTDALAKPYSLEELSQQLQRILPRPGMPE